ncbi:glycosyltransferase family 4 protein [Nostoc sp. UHCC 0302]|uniref:glycosyltransferase family 4 protein n=1 Tax=Nostoc sp. UHCC 0302 TaxID=3134896 RepID=UPI00311CC2BB
MKILLVNTLYYPNIIGGAERSVQILSESLVQNGDEAVVVSTFSGVGTKLDWINGVKVYYVGLKNLYWQFQDIPPPKGLNLLWHTFDTFNFLMVNELEKIIDIELPDIVHTNNLAGFSVWVWRLIKKRKLPLIHTLRDYYLLCPRSGGMMYRKGKNCHDQCQNCKLFTIPRHELSAIPDAVVGISHFILNRHLTLGYFNKVAVREVIHNAYQAPTILPSCKVSSLQGKPLTLGYIGRIDQTKGIELLLQALEQIPQQDWELKVAGKAPDSYKDTLEKRYPMPNVRYLGFIKPEEFFSNIDVLVVPSLWQEPLGRTVLEAYAHGVPVIGSNKGGIPEIIEEGRTGFVFNTEHLETLKNHIVKFINTPHLIEETSINAQVKSKEFTLDYILDSYLKVYKSVSVS